MSSDPAVSGKDATRVLEKFGFRLDRVEGSHHMLVKDGHPCAVVIPVHGSKRTLASIIPISGVGKKRFFAALKETTSANLIRE